MDEGMQRRVLGPLVGSSSRLTDLAKYTGNPKDTLILLTTIVVGGIVVYSWWNALDNWFVMHWPDGQDPRPRFAEAAILTCIALLAIYLLSKVK